MSGRSRKFWKRTHPASQIPNSELSDWATRWPSPIRYFGFRDLRCRIRPISEFPAGATSPFSPSIHMRIDFSQLDRAAVLQMRTLFRRLRGFAKIGFFNQVVTANHFLRFSERTVYRPPVFHRDESSALFQLIPASGLPILPEPVTPRDVVLDNLLHLFRCVFRKVAAAQ